MLCPALQHALCPLDINSTIQAVAEHARLVRTSRRKIQATGKHAWEIVLSTRKIFALIGAALCIGKTQQQASAADARPVTVAFCLLPDTKQNNSINIKQVNFIMSERNLLFVNPHPQLVDMESVKHQYLTDDDGRQLLQRLQEIVAACMPDKEIIDTISNYHIEMMLSCVLVSKRQYQTLHSVVEKAKQSLKNNFGETAACRNAITAEVYVKRVEVVDACSYALPGQPGHPPIIVINSSLIELMNEDELQAVILHELGHILYTSSEYIQSMKILLDILSDGSIMHSFLADTQTAKFNQLLVGFELTADRVMKICMRNDWNAIQSMFAKLAGGLKTMEVDANEFVQQYKKLNEFQAQQLSLISQTKREHPPVLYRLMLLRNYQVPSGAYVGHG
jgi:hypothetical protein